MLRHFVVRLDRSHPGCGRALAAPLDEPADGVGLALGDDLDTPIRQVARPTAHAQGLRLLGACAAVPDTLDAA